MLVRTSVLLISICFICAIAEEYDESIVYGILKKAKNQIQNIKSATKENLENSFSEVINKCPEKDKKQLKTLWGLGFDLILNNTEKVDPKVLEIDDELLEQFFSIYCAIGICGDIIPNMIEHLAPKSSLRIIKVITNLTEKTELTENFVNVDFIRNFHEAMHVEKDVAVSKSLETLVRGAMKVDLVKQKDNIQQLYQINETLAKEVINELIFVYTALPIETYRDLTSFPLFGIIKCSSNIDIWIDNLHTVFKMLKSQNKLYSIQSLILLQEVGDLIQNNNDNNQLLAIKSEIPEAVKIILESDICVSKSNEINKTLPLYVVNLSKFITRKFVPNPEGDHTLLSGSAEDLNFTLVLNVRDDDALENVFEYYDFKKEIGNLERAHEKGKCGKEHEIPVNPCSSLASILPTTNLKKFRRSNLELFKKFVNVYSFTSCRRLVDN